VSGANLAAVEAAGGWLGITDCFLGFLQANPLRRYCPGASRTGGVDEPGHLAGPWAGLAELLEADAWLLYSILSRCVLKMVLCVVIDSNLQNCELKQTSSHYVLINSDIFIVMEI
jgi:hypothetical protein